MVHHDGLVTRVKATTLGEHDQLMVTAIREMASAAAPGEPSTSSAEEDFAGRLGATAVLCRSLKEVERYERILAKSGLPVQRLESYDGTVTGACKVGTYTRVKGLDFKHVFLPCHDLLLREAQTPGIAAREHERLARRQLFVAVTRARDSLWLGSVSSG
jgi:ATP-dependent exoDNAse (exonuclease V) beta subunit